MKRPRDPSAENAHKASETEAKKSLTSSPSVFASLHPDIDLRPSHSFTLGSSTETAPKTFKFFEKDDKKESTNASPANPFATDSREAPKFSFNFGTGASGFSGFDKKINFFGGAMLQQSKTEKAEDPEPAKDEPIVAAAAADDTCIKIAECGKCRAFEYHATAEMKKWKERGEGMLVLAELEEKPQLALYNIVGKILIQIPIDQYFKLKNKTEKQLTIVTIEIEGGSPKPKVYSFATEGSLAKLIQEIEFRLPKK